MTNEYKPGNYITLRGGIKSHYMNFGDIAKVYNTDHGDVLLCVKDGKRFSIHKDKVTYASNKPTIVETAPAPLPAKPQQLARYSNTIKKQASKGRQSKLF